MDKKQVTALRSHFRKVVGTTPVLILSNKGRWGMVVLNDGPADVYIGSSGLTTTSGGMLLASGKSFADNYTLDNWWAVAASSSGTLSGFEMV